MAFISSKTFDFLLIALVSFGGSFCSIGMTEGLRRLVNAGQQKNVPMVWASVYFTVIVIFIWFENFKYKLATNVPKFLRIIL